MISYIIFHHVLDKLIYVVKSSKLNLINLGVDYNAVAFGIGLWCVA